MSEDTRRYQLSIASPVPTENHHWTSITYHDLLSRVSLSEVQLWAHLAEPGDTLQMHRAQLKITVTASCFTATRPEPFHRTTNSPGTVHHFPRGRQEPE